MSRPGPALAVRRDLQRLTIAFVVQAGRRFNDTKRLLADDDPAVAQFSELFGHHTFFFDNRGLNVLELIQVPGTEAQDGEVIRLADWTSADFTSLTTHRPEPTGVVICLREVRH